MKHAYTRRLPDDELRAHLQRGDTVTFEGPVQEWREIEKQVERLGFGDQYAVSYTQHAGPAGHHADTRVSPIHH